MKFNIKVKGVEALLVVTPTDDGKGDIIEVRVAGDVNVESTIALEKRIRSLSSPRPVVEYTQEEVTIKELEDLIEDSGIRPCII